MPNGAYNLSVSHDSSGFTLNGEGPFTFYINNTDNIADTTPPSISLISPSHQKVKGNVLLNASVSDESSIEYVRFSLIKDSDISNQETFYAQNNGSDYWIYNLDTTNLSDGNYDLYVDANDRWDNSGSRIFIIVVDNSAPRVAVLSPERNSYVLTPYASIEVLASDSSGVKNLSIKLNNSDNSTEWVTAHVYNNTSISNNSFINSSHYNYSYTASFTDVVDFTDPTIQIWVNSTDALNNSEVKYLSSFHMDRSPPETYSLSAPERNAVVSGEFSVGINVSDDSGVGELACHNVTRGGINESVCDNSGEGGVQFKINNSGHTYGCHSDLNLVDCWLDADLVDGDKFDGLYEKAFDGSSFPDGLYALYVKVTDSVNEEVKLLHHFSIDNTPPTILLFSPERLTSYKSWILFNVSVLDSFGVDDSSVRFTLESSSGTYSALSPTKTNQGDYWYVNLNIAPHSEGFYNFWVSATDIAGNPVSVKTSSFYIDKTAPEVELDMVPGQLIKGEELIEAEVTDFAGLDYLKFKINRSSYNSDWFDFFCYDGFCEADLDSTEFDDGEYEVWADANDGINNREISKIGSLTIDNSPPEYEVISPENEGYASSRNILINASVNDVAGVSEVRFKINKSGRSFNSGLLQSSLSSGSETNGYWTYHYFNRNFPEGVYDIYIWTNDSLGNSVEGEHLVEFNIDNTAPEVQLTNIEDQEIFGGGEILINASATDDAGVRSLKFRINNSNGSSDWFDATENNSKWNALVNISGLSDGDYRIYVNATDEVDNWKVEGLANIRIDNTPPTIELISLLNNRSFHRTIPINTSVTDNTGVKSVRFKINNSTYNSEWFNASNLNDTYWNVSLNISELEDGLYDIHAEARDSINRIIIKLAGDAKKTTPRRRSSSSSGNCYKTFISTINKFMTCNYLSQNHDFNFKVSSSDLSIDRIEFEVDEYIRDVNLSVEKISSPAAPFTNGEVYEYVLINSNLEESKIKRGFITFYLDKSWLSENELSKSEIVLLRQVNGEWTYLNSYLSDEEEELKYVAETPGFSSLFAIAVETFKPKEEIPVVEEEEVETNVVLENLDEEPEPMDYGVAHNVKETNYLTYLWVNWKRYILSGIGALILAVFFVSFIIRRINQSRTQRSIITQIPNTSHPQPQSHL